MRIISIDNCYDDDGLANAYSVLNSLNGPGPDGSAPDVLVAIIPEYPTEGPLAGRLSRLNFVMRPPDGHDQHVDKRYEQLRVVAAAIVADEAASRQAAEAKLEEPLVVPTDPSRGL